MYSNDGSAPPSLLLVLPAVVFGSLPFAITVSVLSVANSQLSARLKKLATTDDLTGLVSRRSLQESADRLLGAARGTACIALLMIDIDRFKPINDRHGHGVGDQVLRHVASVLRQSLRPDSLIVRYGGDEFCIILPNCREELAAEIYISRLSTELGRVLPGLQLSVGVVQTGPAEFAEPEALIREADRRMYAAKHMLKNLTPG